MLNLQFYFSFLEFFNRKLNLLSFGEEAEEEEKELATVKTKIKSSHDVLNDPRLLKEHPSKDVTILFFFVFVSNLNYVSSLLI